MALPTVDDLIAYLGDSAVDRLPEGEVERVFAAELAQQQTRVKARYFEDDGAIYSDDLLAALLRRCDRHLAMRKMPLAVMVPGDGTDSAPMRMSGRDPEITRLEAPYRRMVTG